MRAPVVITLADRAPIVVRVERTDRTTIARGIGSTRLDAIDDARSQLSRQIREAQAALDALDREATPLIAERGAAERRVHAC